MRKREEIHKKLLEIILSVTGIYIKKMDVSLFSAEYNINFIEMADILLLICKEFKIILNTEFIDLCQDFTIAKIENSIFRFNSFSTI